jgi:processive 1,2-diacylglycerol beta-glucosyltransferase
MRILILTASYGSGHNEAARSLAEGFVARGAAVTVVDHFRELVHPWFAGATRGLYMALLRRAPAVWGAAYALGDRMPSDSPLAFGATRVGMTRLAALLDTLEPTRSSRCTPRRPRRCRRWRPKAAGSRRTPPS